MNKSPAQQRYSTLDCAACITYQKCLKFRDIPELPFSPRQSFNGTENQQTENFGQNTKKPRYVIAETEPKSISANRPARCNYR
jgi:hypothetical protein